MHRVTTYSSRLLRLQFHPEGRFDDRPSFLVPHPPHGSVLDPVIQDGWNVHRTDAAEVRVRGEGPFSPETCEVRFRVNGEERVWRPGMKPLGALGGTTRTLDGTAGDPPTSPGILSRDGWTVVDDSRTVRLDADGWVEPPADAGQDLYLFLHGHDFRGALADFIQLSGRPPLPPRAVLGLWWSRYWRYSARDLKDIVAEFRKHDFPLDVLVLDMDWHLAKDWSGYTWNKELFPDPAGFLDWCHGEGLKTTLNLHPSNGVQAFEEDYETFARALGHPADGSRVPFRCSDRAYMEQYFRRLHHPREDEGVDFWWMDWQQGEVCEFPGLDPLAWLNHLHHLDHDRSDRRGVMLSRWGGLGGHRYPIQFSGDTHTKWETLASQVEFTAESAASLAGWWSHDIGGHMQPCPPELFTRWVQWGALSPALRLHSSNNPKHERRPWAYGPEVEAVCRAAVRFRMRYFPVWIAAAHRFTDTGVAPLTPMWFDHPEHAGAHAARSQAMLGDDLLIAPIVAPMTDGAAERLVWLPPGEWYDVQTLEAHAGDRFIRVTGGLDRMPVFVRVGAVLPIAPGHRTAVADLDPARLAFECWPGDGSGEAVEDEGEGDGWQRGEIARTRLEQTWTGDTIHLRLHPTVGRFPGLPARRPATLFLRAMEKPTSVEGGDWRWEDGTLRIDLPAKLLIESAEVVVRGAKIRSAPSAPAPDVPITSLSPRYDRRKAQLSLADLVLLPPAQGAEAKVLWRAEQWETHQRETATGPLTRAAVLPCPFAWNEERGAMRWSVQVEWTWPGGSRTDTGACAWDLYTGLGEWRIAFLSDADTAPGSLDPKTPIKGASEWIDQSYRRLREESLLDGPRLWCDSGLAQRMGRGIGMFAPDGKLQEEATREEFLHLAAVSEVKTDRPVRCRFVVKALTEHLRVAVDGVEQTLDDEHKTPLLDLAPGRHRVQIVLVNLDVARAIRYFRMLTVIPFDEEGKPLTGLGEPTLR